MGKTFFFTLAQDQSLATPETTLSTFKAIYGKMCGQLKTTPLALVFKDRAPTVITQNKKTSELLFQLGKSPWANAQNVAAREVAKAMGIEPARKATLKEIAETISRVVSSKLAFQYLDISEGIAPLLSPERRRMVRLYELFAAAATAANSLSIFSREAPAPTVGYPAICLANDAPPTVILIAEIEI